MHLFAAFLVAEEILRVGTDIGNLKALFHELLRQQGELHL